MLRVSLLFVLLAMFALFFADISISTGNPNAEIERIVRGFLQPSFARASEVTASFTTTVQLALAAVSISALLGALLAPLYHRWPIRIFATLCRSVHELFWAILLMPLFRITPFCGMLALVIPFTGIFAKIFREIFDESDKSALQAIPKNSDPVSRFLFGIAPGILMQSWKYIAYRVECGLRSSTVLGFLGIPTIGFYLETLFSEGHYHDAAGLLYCFFILVWALRYLLTWYIALIVSLYSIFDTISTFEMAKNVGQFFYEFLPWPLRGEQLFGDWLNPIASAAWNGTCNTVILSLITMVTTGALGLLLFPLVSKNFTGRFVRMLSDLLLIVARTTPELILAYMFLIAVGPSMLPAYIAMTIHNAAIIAYLAGGWSETHKAPAEFSRRRLDRYLFWTLPKLYGQYLAYLFYRWEVIVRESALLGIIGVYTLGFYIDSAIHKDHLDVALLLILISSVLTLLVDGISFLVRRRLNIAGITHCATPAI